jgi:hypothetical protein
MDWKIDLKALLLLGSEKSQAVCHLSFVICDALRRMAVRRFAKRLETDATLARKVKRLQAMLLIQT